MGKYHVCEGKHGQEQEFSELKILYGTVMTADFQLFKPTQTLIWYVF